MSWGLGVGDRAAYRMSGCTGLCLCFTKEWLLCEMCYSCGVL